MDFQLLVHEARQALREAGDMCTAANASFLVIRRNVEESLVLWARAQFLWTALSSQLQNTGNAYILLNHNVSQVEHRSASTLNQLKAAGSSLEGLLGSLKATPLHDDPDRSLYIFVHSEDVAHLQAQVSELEHQLEASSGLTGLPVQAQREISQLRGSMPQLGPVSVDSLGSLCETVAGNLQEMAVLLEGVTQHYDLCCEAETLRDPQEIEEVQQVLEDDQTQLQDAIKTLGALHDLVEKQNLHVESDLASLQETMRELKAFFHKCEHFVNKRLDACVHQIDQHTGQLEQKLSRAAELVGEVEGLCEYYRMFQLGYSALLKEKQRRKKYEEQLELLRAEINATMGRHRQKELKARQEFINRHGEYLPGDIWDQLGDEPEVYTLRAQR